MNERFRLFFYWAYKVGLHLFAMVGFVLVCGFFAIRLHLTDVSGMVDANSDRFEKVLLGDEVSAQAQVLGVENQKNSLVGLDSQISQLIKEKELKAQNFCAIAAIGKHAPGAASKIIKIYQETDCDALVSKMILAARLRVEEKNGKETFAECEKENLQIRDALIVEKYIGAESQTIFPWMNNAEWLTIKDAIVKDKDSINRAAGVAGIEPRLLVSATIVEQVRLFNSEREIFKKFFEPLKILGNANKISLGVMGIKENTAIQTEEHLKDAYSPYYLGPQLASVLDFASIDDIAGQRYARLTAEQDKHYFSYLYGALYLKQMMTQWEKAGFDLKFRPEIVGTLFNVGFPQSHPNPAPKVGGSKIEVDGTQYTFGSLAYEFYYSGELTDAFPYAME
jgi:hypothetical protein